MSERFVELIRGRQSCRAFLNKPVDEKLIYDIIADALNAPSACNSQPWRVFVTNTESENEKMKNCLQDDGKNGFLDGAKAFVAIYETESVKLNAGTESKFSSDHFVEYDIGEFIAYMTLSAKDRGLGSCIIGWVNNDKINATFNLKGKCKIVVAFGYEKDGTSRKKNRLGLKEIVLNYKG